MNRLEVEIELKSTSKNEKGNSSFPKARRCLGEFCKKNKCKKISETALLLKMHLKGLDQLRESIVHLLVKTK